MTVGKADRPTISAKVTLAMIGFNPDRTGHGPNWRLTTPGNSVGAIAVAMFGALPIAHGLQWGEGSRRMNIARATPA